MSKTIREKLIEFHRTMGVPVLSSPQIPPDERVRLRAKLIVEEALEFVEACFGIDPNVLSTPTAAAATETLRCQALELELDEIKGRLQVIIEDLPVRLDLPGAADALADIAYVAEGANLEFGIDSGPVLDEVHGANMAKVGGPIREDGKRLKPPGWQPPDIIGVLVRQMPDAQDGSS